MPRIWAGVDIGKEHHHAVVINGDGERLLSHRVPNDESALLELIGDVLALDEDVLWAVDLNHGGAALLIGLLLSHDQPMGLVVPMTSIAVPLQLILLCAGGPHPNEGHVISLPLGDPS